MIKYLMKKQFKLRRYSLNEHYFNEIHDNDKAYLLGFIAADGCIYENRLIIAQSGNDGRILLEWFKNKLNSTHILYIRYAKKPTHKNSHILTITSPQIVEDLNKHGIIRNKKYKLCFPKTLNLEFLKPYIRGYFDGDGCVGIYIEKKIKKNIILNS